MRDKIICKLFETQPLTLQQLGDHFGVSRERIRQILKENNITGRNRINTQKKEDNDLFKNCMQLIRKSLKIYRIYRCGIWEYEQIKSNIRALYKAHYFNSIRRGIDWDMNLPEWWNIWEKSGNFKNRGPGKYVMARFKDKGSYHKNNVEIITQSENAQNYYAEYKDDWIKKIKKRRGKKWKPRDKNI